MVAAWMAYRSLRKGATGYWPQKPPRVDNAPPSSFSDGFDFARPAISG